VLAAEAQARGKSVDRSKWRLVGLCHIAETKEQAYRDVAYGIEHWVNYLREVATFQMTVKGGTVGEMIDFVNNSGFGAIGTPEDCVAQIERLWKQSNGGFGAYLLLAHNWANPEATRRSFELVAREVMPYFQGHHHPAIDATNHARALRAELMTAQTEAVDAARTRYQVELAGRK
jgi:limonene 1,2-monooxygenase